jgi:hypothetical protein
MDGTTKKNDPGYISHKGIGFKSVFKAASQVHIQSGAFSFSFRNDQDDTGIGLVTPIPEAYNQFPVNVTTRMILTNMHDGTFDDLRAEFDDLPSTLVMFVRKIKRLKVSIHEPNEQVSEREYSYKYEEKSKYGILMKTIDETTTRVFYHVAQHMVRDLPNDPGRPNITHTDVILAFPFVESEMLGPSAKYVPIIEQQHIFAFLPIRPVGFKVQK